MDLKYKIGDKLQENVYQVVFENVVKSFRYYLRLVG